MLNICPSKWEGQDLNAGNLVPGVLNCYSILPPMHFV